MKIKSFLSVCAIAALSACTTPESNHNHNHHGHDHGHNHGHSHNQGSVTSGRATKFECQNGFIVQVRPIGNDKLELALADKRAVLTQTRAASGELYTTKKGLFGKSTEWHAKGNEAFFSFADSYGNQVETSCNAM